MYHVDIDYNNLNVMALEITKLIFKQNPKMINKDDDEMFISLAFLKQYIRICSCLKEISDNPNIFSTKED